MGGPCVIISNKKGGKFHFHAPIGVLVYIKSYINHQAKFQDQKINLVMITSSYANKHKGKNSTDTHKNTYVIYMLLYMLIAKNIYE